MSEMDEGGYSSPPIPYVQSSPPHAARNLVYELTMRQQPKQARMCGIGGKSDRRPIDPPPIIQLRVVDKTPEVDRDGSGESSSAPDPWAFLQNPYYFMFASLAKPDSEEELHWLKDGKTRCTTGSVVSSLYHLKDAERDNEDVGFFVFPDLSVRTEGSYRLKLSLFEIYGSTVRHCKSIFSAPFYVYTAKKFPGMEESSSLSCSLAEQGIKIRIRKDTRRRNRRTRSPGSPGTSDVEDDDKGKRSKKQLQRITKHDDSSPPVSDQKQPESSNTGYPLDKFGQLIKGVTFDDAGRPIPRDVKEAEDKGLVAFDADGKLISRWQSVPPEGRPTSENAIEEVQPQWQNDSEPGMATNQGQTSEAPTSQTSTYYSLPASGTYPPPAPPPPPQQPTYQPQQYYPTYQQPPQTWYDYQQSLYPHQPYPHSYHPQPHPIHQPPYHPHPAYPPQHVPHPHYPIPPPPAQPYWYGQVAPVPSFGGYYGGDPHSHPAHYPGHPPPEYVRSDSTTTEANNGPNPSPGPAHPPRYWDGNQPQPHPHPQTPLQPHPQPQPQSQPQPQPQSNVWNGANPPPQQQPQHQPHWEYHHQQQQQQQHHAPMSMAPLRRVRGREELEAGNDVGDQDGLGGSAKKKRLLSIGSIVEGTSKE